VNGEEPLRTESQFEEISRVSGNLQSANPVNYENSTIILASESPDLDDVSPIQSKVHEIA